MIAYAYVVPVLGKPFTKGDVATVTASCANFLRDHPGYTLSVRRRDKGEGDSSFAVLLFMEGGDLHYLARPAAVRTAASDRALAELVGEILAVLHTMNITVNQGASP